MYNYNKTLVSPYDPIILASHFYLRPEDDLMSSFIQSIRKTVWFDIVHFIGEENIEIYVDFHCGINFYPEIPTKIKQINWDWNYMSRSCQKHKCNPSNDQSNCPFDDQHSSNIFLNPYNLWDMVPAAPMSLNHTNDRDSMSNQYPQLTNLEQTLIRCSLHCEPSTVKGRDCASALDFFKEITYRTDEWTKQLLRLKTWVNSGIPEQGVDFRRLWWTVIVFKCSYFFQLYDFYCLLIQYYFFSRKLTFFCSFLWWLWVRCKIHRQLSCNVTFPLAAAVATYLSTIQNFNLA